jgi:hypothetical protein
MFAAIGDALVEYLNDAIRNYSMTPDAIRTTLPMAAMEEINGLVVEVYPIGQSRSQELRPQWLVTYNIGIAIRKPVVTLTDEDALLGFVDEVADSLRPGLVMAEAVLTSIADRTAYDVTQLVETSIMLIGMQLDFQIVK